MPFIFTLFNVLSVLLLVYSPSPTNGLQNAHSSQTGTLHRRTFFYVGGRYAAAEGGGDIIAGQMYVERLTPEKVTQRLPLIVVHGNGMTGTNFLTTPDGQPGWADYFLSEGYEVYLVDQPARGRSAWQSSVDGEQVVFDARYVEQRFTATQRFGLWPQASLLTQWPGNGSKGDPVFDDFYAAMVPSLASAAEASSAFKAAGSSLLNKVGPCILLTHSQSGQLGWILADTYPELIKGIVAIEPVGPPFINAIFPPFSAARPYGLTEIPVSYSPPIDKPEGLKTFVAYSQPNFTCIQQLAPARQLTNIAKVPVLVVTSESGYHAVYDKCSVEYLRSGGVSVEHIKLKEVGILGNGHMMFMERNSWDIARRVLSPWLRKTL